MKLLQFKKIALVLGQSLHQIQEESPDFTPRWLHFWGSNRNWRALWVHFCLISHLQVSQHQCKQEHCRWSKMLLSFYEPVFTCRTDTVTSSYECTDWLMHFNLQMMQHVAQGANPTMKAAQRNGFALEWTYTVFQPTFLKMQHFQK